MASAARKRLLRQQANAAKGKATRKYTKTDKIWEEKSKAAAATRVKKPKTDSQLQAQYEKDQLRIAQLEEEVAKAKQETLYAKRECMVARAELQMQKQPAALQEENNQLLEELKKQKDETNKWKERCEAIKTEYRRRVNNLPQIHV